MLFRSIWETLKTISPVLKENGERYELNVSCYTDTRSLGTDIGTGAFGTVGQTSTGSESGFGGGFGGGFGSQDSSFEGGFGSNGSSGFGGSFGGDFGRSNSFGDNAGFGAQENKAPAEEISSEDFMPDNPDKEVSYDPEPLYTMTNANSNPSLSEAEAVANFISVKYGTEIGRAHV